MGDTDSEKSFRTNDSSETEETTTDNEQLPEVDDLNEDKDKDWETRFDLDTPLFEDLPILSEFTEQELNLLPLSYIRGPLEQWNYIYDAVKSEFTYVANLAKVNDRTLRNVTDVIRYSSMKGNSVTKLQKDILRYETKRLQ